MEKAAKSPRTIHNNAVTHDSQSNHSHVVTHLYISKLLGIHLHPAIAAAAFNAFVLSNEFYFAGIAHRIYIYIYI